MKYTYLWVTTTDWTVFDTEIVVEIVLAGVTDDGEAVHFVQTVWVLVTKRVDKVGTVWMEV